VPLKLQLSCESETCAAMVQPPRIVALLRSGEALNIAVLDLDAGSVDDDGLVFRPANCQWIYNLSAVGLLVASYLITIETPDGSRYDGGFVCGSQDGNWKRTTVSALHKGTTAVALRVCGWTITPPPDHARLPNDAPTRREAVTSGEQAPLHPRGNLSSLTAP
jgi:hypothetical protein